MSRRFCEGCDSTGAAEHRRSLRRGTKSGYLGSMGMRGDDDQFGLEMVGTVQLLR